MEDKIAAEPTIKKREAMREKLEREAKIDADK